MALHITSAAFADGQTIPQKYSCDGEDVSPPLEWHGMPNRAKSLALICDDPDAPSGTFTHWVLYDIPAATTRLSEGAANTGKPGLNSFGKTGYGGPCPPHKDAAHQYVFHVYSSQFGHGILLYGTCGIGLVGGGSGGTGSVGGMGFGCGFGGCGIDVIPRHPGRHPCVEIAPRAPGLRC